MRVSENKLMEFILEAMPLILFKRQLPDGRRVYDEIFEGLKVEDGRIVGRTLFKYVVKENIYDDNGEIVKVVGEHVLKNKMSDALMSRLKYGGASDEMLRRFL